MQKVSKTMICVVMAMVCFTGTVLATSLNDLERQQQNLNKTQKSTEQKLKNTKLEMTEVIKDIETLDKKIKETEDRLSDITVEFNATNEELTQAEKELKETQTEKDKKYEIFKTRVKYIHENGKIGYLQVLINANSFSDLLNRVQYLRDIVEYDNSIVEQLEVMETKILSKKQTITNKKIQIEVLLNEETSKKKMLEEDYNASQKLRDELEASEEKLIAQLDALEEDSKRVEALIKKKLQEAAANSTGPKYTGGKFSWPTDSTVITSPYGMRKHPIYKVNKMHTGIDLRAPMSSNIYAAGDGEVISSGYNGGYGYTIIINHGGGITTLYAHNSKLLVSEGATVKMGQVIAKAGSTGTSTGPHLHFEVRVNGSHTNPVNYLN